MPTMLPDGRRLGAHLPLAAGMVKAVDRAHVIGADALQIFSDNPTAWRRRAEPPVELARFRARLRDHDIRPVAVHAPYLINLAGPDEDFYNRSVEMLGHELRVAPTFGARFVNVHIGSHGGAGVDAGIARLADAVTRAVGDIDDTPDSAMLVLENSAGSGYGLGVDIDELAAIATALADRGVPRHRVGFCLDIAHAWAAGIDLGSDEASDAFMTSFDARIGIERLVLVHLNDSRSEFGSRVDRHEHIGAGRIGPETIRRILRHASLRNATYILETPGMDEGYDAINMARARDLAAGRTLAPLPEAAFTLRGSRARMAPA